jgi:hypothetical protein
MSAVLGLSCQQFVTACMTPTTQLVVCQQLSYIADSQLYKIAKLAKKDNCNLDTMAEWSKAVDLSAPAAR